MPVLVAAFVAGAWLLQQQPELPGWGPGLAAAGLALAAACAGKLGPGRLRPVALALALGAAFAAGFGWAAVRAQWRLADALPSSWEGRDVRLEGVIAALPQSAGALARFEFEVERILTPGAIVPRRVMLSWWGARIRGASSGAGPELAPGERWRLTVRLRRPHGGANPHGFDYEYWLLERALRATGYVRTGDPALRLAPLVHAPLYWVERARDVLRMRIVQALEGEPYAGVIAALAIGDQRAIPPEQWRTFTRTGVNHLMSISGLHVTMISGLVYALVSGLWRRSPRLALAFAAPRAASLAGLTAAFAYALLAGFAVPAQRTVYMLAVVAAALWFGAGESPLRVLSLALLAVVVLDPWAVLAPGFWLSFGAVAAIFYACAGRLGPEPRLYSWCRVQVAVTVALVPPLLALFQHVSAVSLLANAFAIPLVGLVVVPLALAGAVAPFDFVLDCAHAALRLAMWPLEALAAAPFAVWTQPAPPAAALFAAVAGVLVLLAPPGFPARWLGLVLFAPLFAAAPTPVAPGALQLTVLDVGHGLAAVARTAHHALVYDTGPSFGAHADSGSRTLLPFLRASGVKRVDVLVVSHDDDDHSGGAQSLLEALPVDRVLASLPEADPILVQAEQGLRCFSGQRWQWDGVTFEILHPERERLAETPARTNDRSCVLRIVAAGASVLLPGDIEKRSERTLVGAHGAGLRADVLLAPHQGSRTSSSAPFVEAVSPRAVVFPVGYRNRFGHPHPEVVARYRAIGAALYRTDRDGAVSIEIGPSGEVAIEPYRSRHRRYWRLPWVGEPAPRGLPQPSGRR